MDLQNLFLSCRSGDLERVKQLVEEREIEVNVRDRWDSTPLYYACLCGHYPVVEYLLSIGAKCNPHTFDGERCIYGALNNDIRNLLTKEYKVLSSTTKRREFFGEFLRRLCDSGEFADVIFVVHGFEMPAHRCILAARSAYFNSMFDGPWQGRSRININHPQVKSVAFYAIMQYLYTGQLDIAVVNIDDTKRLAKQCRLRLLLQRLEDFQREAQFFQRTKPGTHVTSIMIEQPTDERELSLNEQFVTLAECALPPDLRQWAGSEELPINYVDLDERPTSSATLTPPPTSTRIRTTSNNSSSSYGDDAVPLHMDDAPLDELAPSCDLGVFADVIFEVRGKRFACNQAFFCSRSEYFRTLVGDPFGEFDVVGGLKQIPLKMVTPVVFAVVVYYVYADAADRLLTKDTVIDVLSIADLYLLPGLKRQCGVYLSKLLDRHNVVEALELARTFDLSKLEDQCSQFLADHFEQMMGDVELHRLIRSDAAAVTDRHETDTIDIVDNIRYHMVARNLFDAQERTQLVDLLLEQLELDA